MGVPQMWQAAPLRRMAWRCLSRVVVLRVVLMPVSGGGGYRRLTRPAGAAAAAGRYAQQVEHVGIMRPPLPVSRAQPE